jgi:hypothetical protein
MFLAQNAYSYPNGSGQLTTALLVGLVLGFAILFAMLKAPTQLRRPIVAGTTFVAGLYYILFWLWPTPIDRQPDELPANFGERVGFWLADANPAVSNFRNIIAAFLIGLGIYSLFRIHVGRIAKQQKDWSYSLVLLGSLVLMFVVGILDWRSRQGGQGASLDKIENWGAINYAQDFLFDGLLQQMDAAMFSLIAFYILSAAYRAFRARSAEAGILLVTALLVMLSLLGVVSLLSNQFINSIGGSDPASFMANFKLDAIAGWIRGNVQSPAIRGLQFGVGVGLLALALRIWLSLEKSGGSN